jgi:hypothetical protein
MTGVARIIWQVKATTVISDMKPELKTPEHCRIFRLSLSALPSFFASTICQLTHL